MYHSVIFIDKSLWDQGVAAWLGEDTLNTWDDWKIVPSSRPVFNPPKQKTQYLDIPGADGSLDISEALTGYSIFENREGSLDFYVWNDYGQYNWAFVYETISNALHGQQMRAILEDDPGFFYEGRFQVDNWASDKDYSKITINYTVKPYKYEITSSIEEWLWDPFNFETGFIMQNSYKDIYVNSSANAVTRKFTYNEGGLAPFCPEFQVTTSSSITVKYYNAATGQSHEATLGNGSTFIPEMMIFGGDVTLSFIGRGTVSIIFRRGRL